MQLPLRSIAITALKWPLLNLLVHIFNAAVKKLQLHILMYPKLRSKDLYYSIGKGFVLIEFNGLINEDRRANLLIALSVFNKEIENFI